MISNWVNIIICQAIPKPFYWCSPVTQPFWHSIAQLLKWFVQWGYHQHVSMGFGQQRARTNMHVYMHSNCLHIYIYTYVYVCHYCIYNYRFIVARAIVLNMYVQVSIHIQLFMLTQDVFRLMLCSWQLLHAVGWVILWHRSIICVQLILRRALQWFPTSSCYAMKRRTL